MGQILLENGLVSVCRSFRVSAIEVSRSTSLVRSAFASRVTFNRLISPSTQPEGVLDVTSTALSIDASIFILVTYLADNRSDDDCPQLIVHASDFTLRGPYLAELVHIFERRLVGGRIRDGGTMERDEWESSCWTIIPIAVCFSGERVWEALIAITLAGNYALWHTPAKCKRSLIVALLQPIHASRISEW